MLAKSSDPNDHVFHLYVRPKDPKAEMWEGPRSGTDAARDVFNADEVLCNFYLIVSSLWLFGYFKRLLLLRQYLQAGQTGSISSLSSLLPRLLSSASAIYTDIPFHPSKASPSLFGRFLNSLKSSSSSTSTAPSTEQPLSSILSSQNLKLLKPFVHELRAFKSENEIRLMRQIGQATGRTFQEIMKRNWEYESDIEAWMEYHFRKSGMEGSAYIPVVAGGKVCGSVFIVAISLAELDR